MARHILFDIREPADTCLYAVGAPMCPLYVSLLGFLALNLALGTGTNCWLTVEKETQVGRLVIVKRDPQWFHPK